MKGIEELVFGIKAGYSYFYAESQEIKKTTADVQEGLTAYFAANQNGIKYQVKTWGFESTNPRTRESSYNNPDEMLDLLERVIDGVDTVPAGTVVVAQNYNWFLVDQYGECDKAKTAWLLNRAAKFSDPEYRKILIIVGNIPFEKAIPDILKRDFGKIEFPLPDEAEIEKIYNFIVDSVKANPKFVMPTEKEKCRIIAGAKGLTQSEITKVFSYSIVKNQGIFDPATVEELRADEINTTPGLKIGKYNKDLDDLMGYEVAKEIVDEWVNDSSAKGIIILGPAGVGKTHFAQSIASHYNRLIIELEFAQLMGDGLVGQAEKAMKKALDVIRANANPLAPIIVFVDEIEKGLSGMKGGGNNDGGTSMRSNAQFLKFLSDDRPEGIYVVATCNNIESMPPEFIRVERYDCAPLFVDLPNQTEQMAIFGYYRKVFNIPEGVNAPEMVGWSGAEIKTWCKLARKKLDLGKNANDADQLIVPISQTMAKEIDYLRKWKEGKTVAASKPIVMAPQLFSREININI